MWSRQSTESVAYTHASHAAGKGVQRCRGRYPARRLLAAVQQPTLVWLARFRQQQGAAEQWNVNSIHSVLPRFFEGQLLDLNLGTCKSTSCDPALAQTVFGVVQEARTDCYNGGDVAVFATSRLDGKGADELKEDAGGVRGFSGQSGK